MTRIRFDETGRKRARKKPRARAAKPARPMTAVGTGLVYWSPVWIALIFLAQVAIGGLRPALEEARALEIKGAELGLRLRESQARLARVDSWLAAQEDPIYRERMRRRMDAIPRILEPR